MGITKHRVTEEYSFLNKRLVTAKEKWKELYRPLEPTLESFHKSKMNFKVLLRTIIIFYFIVIFFSWKYAVENSVNREQCCALKGKIYRHKWSKNPNQ